MVIGGLTKLTLLDYPGLVACTVFFSGCNFRCPFCHNRPLVLPRSGELQPISRQALLDFLRSRQGKLDGVCLTGGEPTLWDGLPALAEELHALGYRVKLDTNGSNPAVLGQLIDRGLVDYVAMDIKNAPSRYAQTCGGVEMLPQVEESVARLRAGPVPFEFRTTVAHPFHTPETMAQLGRWLQGTERYFLQPFVDSGDLVGAGVTPLTQDELQVLLAAVRPFIPAAKLRGI